MGFIVFALNAIGLVAALVWFTTHNRLVKASEFVTRSAAVVTVLALLGLVGAAVASGTAVSTLLVTVGLPILVVAGLFVWLTRGLGPARSAE